MGAAQVAPGYWISHEPRRPVVAPGEEAGEAGCVLTRVTDMQTMGPTQQMAFVAAIGRVMKRDGITDEMASSPWSFEFPPPEQVNQQHCFGTTMPSPRVGSKGNTVGDAAPRNTRILSKVDAADNKGPTLCFHSVS